MKLAVGLILLIACFLNTPSYGQQTPPEPVEQFNERGWKIPSVKDLEVQDTTVLEVGDKKFEQINYRLNKTDFITELGNDLFCEFKNLTFYFLEDGQQFAVSGICVIFSNFAGNRSYAAAVTGYIFYFDRTKMVFTRRLNFAPGHKEKIASILSQ